MEKNVEIEVEPVNSIIYSWLTNYFPLDYRHDYNAETNFRNWGPSDCFWLIPGGAYNEI